MLRVGMIGAGIIAKNHADALKDNEGVVLAAVADIVPARAEALGQAYRARAYTDYREMIQQEKLDIALINLPHGLHAEAAVFCAQNGLHVFLEKPMANTVADCRAIIEACERHRVTLMVGHIQGYMARNIQARELVQSGRYGTLASVTEVRNVHYFAPERPAWFFDPALSGGGIVMNYGAHSIDRICFVSGLAVTDLKAQVRQHLSGYEIEGSAQILLGLEQGVSAVISYTGYRVPTYHETTFYLTEGVVQLSADGALRVSLGGAFEQVAVPGGGQEFVLMWRDFCDAIRQGTTPRASGAYGLEIIRWIERIYAQGG
ncbi:MAG: Gfo/Idh/MocA family oxidoreductase [Eubacteriales bacterium]